VKYASDVYRLLQSIYDHRVSVLYQDSHPHISEDAISSLTETLEQKQSTLQHQINLQQQAYQPPFHSSSQSANSYQPPAPQHFTQSYLEMTALEQEQLRNQVFLIDLFSLRLKSLYQQERI
jgi:hypothetical protein